MIRRIEFQVVFKYCCNGLIYIVVVSKANGKELEVLKSQRKRRSAENAKNEILEAAEEILLKEGPSSIRLQKVAKKVGISHPGVLHHFKTVEKLLEALEERISLKIRNQFIASLNDFDQNNEDSIKKVTKTFSGMSDSRQGKLLAWLIASGKDPFPPAEEKGLYQVVKQIQNLETTQGKSEEDIQFFVELATLTFLGDAMFGQFVRKRINYQDNKKAGKSFRSRFLGLLVNGMSS